MTDQQPTFVHTFLDSKLQERLATALRFINALPQEDVLRIDNAGLTEIVREFAVAPPIVRRDLMVADERVLESLDLISERKTGQTLLEFLLPVEREVDWLEEVRDQRTGIDNNPLAFLERKRSMISIRLAFSPDEAEGELKRET